MRTDAPDGFALVAALWILAIVGGVMVAFQSAASTERLVAINARSATQARWAARAAHARILDQVNQALVGRAGAPLLITTADTVLPPLELARADVRVRALALDARARVQLNLADGEDLRHLFLALGLGVNRASAMADAILDWRDPDPVRRPGGAEAPEYRNLRPPYRPGDNPFSSVDELRRVIGVTPETYARIAPFLTVAGDGRINVNAAPAPVLLTLPGIDAEAAAAIIARRGSRAFSNVYEMTAALPREARDRIEVDIARLSDRAAFGPRDLEIEAIATAVNAPTQARLHSVIHLSGGSSWSLERVVEW